MRKYITFNTKEYNKRYYRNHRAKILRSVKRRCLQNRDRINAYKRQWWKRNRSMLLKKKRLYRLNNHEKILEYMRTYNKKLYHRKKHSLGIPNGTPYEKCVFLKKILDEVLEESGVREKKFSWLKSSSGWQMSYDIFYPSKNLAVEYNGIQHYRHHPFFHSGNTTLTIQRKNDRRKRYLSKKYGIRLIIVPYQSLTIPFLMNKLRKLCVWPLRISRKLRG